MMIIHRILLIIIGLLLSGCERAGAEVFESEQQHFRLSTVVEGLEQPWAFAFLPDNQLLITEKGGVLRRVSDGRLQKEPIGGLPDIAVVGQGGLLDVAIDPDFADNRLVYISYAAAGEGGHGTEVARGRLVENRLEDIEVIFRALPKFSGGQHFGSRLLFHPDGHLYITLGDRGNKDQAQKLESHPGSLIRIHSDGSVPDDNPFVGRDGVRPEIYTYGNRNMQGIALQPGSNQVWTQEHGPQGGDEVNAVEAGSNYGWPVITYGKNYVTGTRIGEGTHKEGMVQPRHYWVPSIATSGMTFYNGDKLSGWQNDLFNGSLKFGFISRLELNNDHAIAHEERLLEDKLQRVRDIRQGPDGNLYVLDEAQGRLYRLEPAE